VAEAAGDDLVRRELRDVLALEGDAALLGPEQAGDGAQGGGLARAVAADERDDAAGLDGNDTSRSALMAP
jgi:hypothetical protein